MWFATTLPQIATNLYSFLSSEIIGCLLAEESDISHGDLLPQLENGKCVSVLGPDNLATVRKGVGIGPFYNIGNMIW